MSSGWQKKVKEILLKRGLTFINTCDILMTVKQIKPLGQPMLGGRFLF